MNIHTFIYDKTACPIHDYDNEKKKKKSKKRKARILIIKKERVGCNGSHVKFRNGLLLV